MPNLHWTRLGLCALLAAAAMPLAAQPAAEVEGIYQDEVFEVASTLALSPSGRFLWVFSMGALDVAAEGRWTRESDGTVVLNSEPVLAPRFELVGRSRDDRPGIAVRLACDSREAAQFLDVVVEYADGERVAHNFSELEYRTTAEDSPRPVAAVQVGSGAFDLISERVPVNPQEANVFTFRFIPNDLGRVEFRNQRVAVETGAVTALSLDWRGTPLRYTREGSAAGEELPRLPPMPNAAARPHRSRSKSFCTSRSRTCGRGPARISCPWTATASSSRADRSTCGSAMTGAASISAASKAGACRSSSPTMPATA